MGGRGICFVVTHDVLAIQGKSIELAQVAYKPRRTFVLRRGRHQAQVTAAEGTRRAGGVLNADASLVGRGSVIRNVIVAHHLYDFAALAEHIMRAYLDRLAFARRILKELYRAAIVRLTRSNVKDDAVDRVLGNVALEESSSRREAPRMRTATITAHVAASKPMSELT